MFTCIHSHMPTHAQYQCMWCTMWYACGMHVCVLVYACTCLYVWYNMVCTNLYVGAVDEKNKMPYYAEPCPCMLAVTYSNGHSVGDRNIATTDASTHGGCTKSFSGTSAAAPIAAGMVALMLQTRSV